jgi:septal ring factor EnvC (AmiA/AmiB activator)
MDDAITIAKLIDQLPTLIMFLSLLVTIYVATRNKSKDEGDEMTQIKESLIRMDVKQDAAVQQITEVNGGMKELRESMTAQATRLAQVEASAKSAHHRLDRLEGEIGETNRKER